MSVFPTFRLPFVAAKAVVNQLDLGELTALFLCSKETRAFVKSLRKSVSFAALSTEQKNSLNFLEIIELFRESKLAGNFFKEFPMDVDIHISDEIGFELDVQYKIDEYDFEDYYFRIYAECIDQQNQYKGVKSILTIGGIEVPVVMTKKNEMYMFWENKQEGFKKMGNCLVGNFVTRFSGLCVNGGSSNKLSENLKFVINWTNSTYKHFMYCIVDDQNRIINDEDIKFIIDTHASSTSYDFSVGLSDQFQPTKHFKSWWLKLKPANWFTRENLFNTECEKIRLEKSKLTNNDLKDYLQEWMAGKFSDLRSLYVEMQEDMDIDIILSCFKDSHTFKITRYDDHVLVKWNVGGYRAIKILTPGSTSTTFEMKIALELFLNEFSLNNVLRF